MKRSNYYLPLCLIVILGLLLGNLFFLIFDKPPSKLQTITWSPDVQWITSSEPSYKLYARHTFYVSDSIQRGWLRISADNDFTLYVNGKEVASENSVLDNSLSFKSKLSEGYQGFNDSAPYSTKNRPNFMLSNFHSWKLATYVDISPYMVPGKNVLGLELQKGRKTPRVALEGYVYQVPDLHPIVLNTGQTPWQVSILPENRDGLKWFNPDFPDQHWLESITLGNIREPIYSRLSKNLFDLPLQGSQISGDISKLGEVWLRGVWQVPSSEKRSFVRLSSNSEYDLLLNGHIIKHFDANSNQIYMYEVTHFLHTGKNYLAVRLASNLSEHSKDLKNNISSPSGIIKLFLDGWSEDSQGKIVKIIATDRTWQSLSEPVEGWAEGRGEVQTVNLLEEPNRSLKRVFTGNAYLLNFPDYLWHNFLWALVGITLSATTAYLVGSSLLSQYNWKFESMITGISILTPGICFLLLVSLLNHRYAESEMGLLFAQPQAESLILIGFISVLGITLLWNRLQPSIKKDAKKVESEQFTSGIAINPTKSNTLSGLVPTSLLIENLSKWFLLGFVFFIGLGALIIGDELPMLLLLSAFLGVLLAGLFTGYTLIWAQRKQPKNILSFKFSYKNLIKSLPKWSKWFWLAATVGIGFMLRLYDIGFANLDWDEGISLDASRGILYTGSPIATSGIWYSRSPFYHFMLALWLRIGGDSIINARILSVVWGTATLILVYFFIKELTKKDWIALLTTVILSVDPFLIWYSRNIRFYQVLQFMTLLSFWLFCKGFINKEGKKYQYGFFLISALMLFSQELNVTFMPCFLIGFLYFYRPFVVSKEWHIIASSLMLLVVYIFNAIVFSVKTLTPWVALSGRTAPQIKLHLYDVSGFLSVLFAGPSRMSVIYCLFFFSGFAFFIKQKNSKIIFLFSSILINLILLTILTFGITSRYIYSNYLLFVILAIYSSICIAEALGNRLSSITSITIPFKQMFMACVLLLLYCNLELGRVLGGYKDAITARNDEVFEYIKTNRKSGDIVISNIPPAAITSLVKLDYHLPQIREPDFANLYLKNGAVIDRGAGSIAITNLDQIPQILSKSERAWIHFEQFREERIEPDMIEYVNNLGHSVIQPFGASLRLWQLHDGIPKSLPNEGKDLGNY